MASLESWSSEGTNNTQQVVYHGALLMSKNPREHLARVWRGTVVDKWIYYNKILPHLEEVGS